MAEPTVTYAQALERVRASGTEAKGPRWPPFGEMEKAQLLEIEGGTRAWLWDAVFPYDPGETNDDPESVLSIWYETPDFSQNDRSAEVLTAPIGHAPAVRLMIDDHGDSYTVELAFFGEGSEGLLVIGSAEGALSELFGVELTWTGLDTWTLGNG